MSYNTVLQQHLLIRIYIQILLIDQSLCRMTINKGKRSLLRLNESYGTVMHAQNIGGYFYDSETKTLPVFINYDKAEDAIAYEDRFVSQQNLIALSKHPRKVDSSDADHFYKRTEEDKDNRIFLFVRKNKDDKEAKEFYFLGEIFANGAPIPIKMEKTKDDAFEINYTLDVPVRDDIYEYMTSQEFYYENDTCCCSGYM